jgi:hypothetical protein
VSNRHPSAVIASVRRLDSVEVPRFWWSRAVRGERREPCDLVVCTEAVRAAVLLTRIGIWACQSKRTVGMAVVNSS